MTTTILEALNTLDADILVFFNSFHNSFFDTFMMHATGRFTWIPMYIAIMCMLVKAFKTREIILYAIGITLTILFADQICATFLRPMFERLRPSNLENPLSAVIHVVDGYRGGSYGFPSCHGANSFALAVFLSLVFSRKRFTIFIFAWAILNSYSRIYLGVH